MKIYIPYYDKNYHIQEADAEKARRIGRYWTYNGWIYGDVAYTTQEGAEAYINKQYHAAKQAEYMPFRAGTLEATA